MSPLGVHESLNVVSPSSASGRSGTGLWVGVSGLEYPRRETRPAPVATTPHRLTPLHAV